MQLVHLHTISICSAISAVCANEMSRGAHVSEAKRQRRFVQMLAKLVHLHTISICSAIHLCT